MRKVIAIFGFLMFFVVGGCEKANKDISLANFMEEIKSEAKFKDGVLEDLTDPEIARQYGINPSDITEGYVYYEKDGDKSEKIIILEAVNEKSIEDLEKAVQNESIGLNKRFEDDTDESEKLSKSFTKTSHNYVILVNSEQHKALEKKIDEKLKQ